MTQPSGFDFTKFVPGFDFLKNLTPAAGAAGGAPAPGWVAPTLDPEELEKRIQELKTVHFWLEQNTKAVAATIQALEVQRMTLSTLKGMNLSFHELAESLKVKAQAPAAASASEAPAPAQEEAQPNASKPAAKSAGKSSKPKDAAAAGVDPSQWWGALTDQFQHIANKAMKDMAHSASSHAGAASAAGGKASAPKAKPAAKKAARKTARPAARKAAAKTSRA